jgi:hypothetical protein
VSVTCSAAEAGVATSMPSVCASMAAPRHMPTEPI